MEFNNDKLVWQEVLLISGSMVLLGMSVISLYQALS